MQLYTYILLPLVTFLSSILAYFHVTLVKQRLVTVPRIIIEAPGTLYCTLREIWFARLLRRLLSVSVRTSLRSRVVKLVNASLTLPERTGCVIALCHTPWARVLAEWCRVQNFALVLAGGAWANRTGRVNVPERGILNLRRLARHLMAGGRAVVMADIFVGAHRCATQFLGNDCAVSTLPARLAALTHVPLLAIVPELKDGSIQLYNGLTLEIETVAAAPTMAMKTVMNFFDREIRLSPARWGSYVKDPLQRMTTWTPAK